jgi:hypothetical protein
MAEKTVEVGSSPKVDEKQVTPSTPPENTHGGLFTAELNEFERAHVESDLNVTEEDLLEAKETAANFTLDDVRTLMKDVLDRHHRDPNFPHSVLEKIREFLGK